MPGGWRATGRGAITIDAATILGLAHEVGSLEVGKRANLFIAKSNLVVTDGDLLGEKTKVRHVFVAGRLIQTEP